MMRSPSIWKHVRDIILLPFTVTIIIPYLIYRSQQPFVPDHSIFKIIGMFFLFAGCLLLFWTISLFGKIGKGTLAPWSPTQKLVISGPYCYCRNPMITGVFFILTGEALLFNSTNILLLAGVFFIINTVYFI